MEQRPIAGEISKSYLEYAMSVIVSRAIPDVRDGLKPVQRRILYAMWENNFTHDKPYRKSARIVGEVMGKYHPHGDSAIYDAMARMAQDFSLRYPLIDGQGNFGSLDGDEPAAMRYTEARMNAFAESMLEGIDKETVPFRLNFDGSLNEPDYLPSSFPNLLINGSSGIAVGMATNLLPHNLNEVGEAMVHMIREPDINIHQIMEHIKGPDFPGGGTIWITDDMLRGYETGRGKIICRGDVDTDDKKRIIITSLPYGVNKSVFLENIVKHVDDGKIEGITDVKDESNKDGMRIVIKVKDEERKQLILNQLYSKTELEQSISINNLVLLNNEPKQMNIKQMLSSYVDHRLNVILKRSQFDHTKMKEREHILSGLEIALNSIDLVIKIIRGSKDAAEAKTSLMNELSLTDPQVVAILEMRLQRLTSLEVDKVRKELEEVRIRIKELEEIIGSESVRRNVLISEIEELIRKYGDERRTKVEIGNYEALSDESTIPNEPCVVLLTEKGFIKRVTLDEYKPQNRGGKGVLTSARDDDAARIIVHCNAHDNLMFFTDTGRVYVLKTYRIETKRRTGVGVIASAFLKLAEGERVINIIKFVDVENSHLVIATKNGYIKKTELSSFGRVLSTGIRAIGLEEDDAIISVFTMGKNRDVIAVSSSGKAARFSAEELRSTGRTSRGVKSMRLGEGDSIMSVFCVESNESVLTISARGLGKRTMEEEFPVHHRGSSGVKIMKVTPRTGNIVVAMPVKEEDELLIVTNYDQTIRIKVSTIRMVGRNSQGVRLIDLSGNDQVISAGKVEAEQ